MGGSGAGSIFETVTGPPAPSCTVVAKAAVALGNKIKQKASLKGRG